MSFSKADGLCSGARPALDLDDHVALLGLGGPEAVTEEPPVQDEGDWVIFDAQRKRLAEVFGITGSGPVRRPRDWNSRKLNFEYVTDQAGLNEVVAATSHPSVTVVALDIETTGLTPWMSSIRLIQLAVETPEPRQFLIDCWAIDPTPALGCLSDPDVEVVTCNGSFEQVHTGYHFGVVIRKLFDISYGSKIVGKARGFSAHWSDGKRKLGHNFRVMMRRYTGKRISKTEQTGDWHNETLTASQKRYAAMDVAGALDIRHEIQADIDSAPMVVVDSKTGEMAEVWEAVAAKNAKTVPSCLDQIEVRLGESYDAVRIERAILHAATRAEVDQAVAFARRMSIHAAERARLSNLAQARILQLSSAGIPVAA